MPRITIKTGCVGRDGREEELAEYICDATDCPNVASHVLGCVKELRRAVVVCHEHAAVPDSLPPDD